MVVRSKEKPKQLSMWVWGQRPTPAKGFISLTIFTNPVTLLQTSVYDEAGLLPPSTDQLPAQPKF